MGHVSGVIGWRKVGGRVPLGLPRGRKRGEQRRTKATKSHPQVQIGPDSSGRKRQSTPDRSGFTWFESSEIRTCLDLSGPISTYLPQNQFSPGRGRSTSPVRAFPAYSRIFQDNFPSAFRSPNVAHHHAPVRHSVPPGSVGYHTI
jgi:hypothetical protein